MKKIKIIIVSLITLFCITCGTLHEELTSCSWDLYEIESPNKHTISYSPLIKSKIARYKIEINKNGICSIYEDCNCGSIDFKFKKRHLIPKPNQNRKILMTSVACIPPPNLYTLYESTSINFAEILCDVIQYEIVSDTLIIKTNKNYKLRLIKNQEKNKEGSNKTLQHDE